MKDNYIFDFLKKKNNIKISIILNKMFNKLFNFFKNKNKKNEGTASSGDYGHLGRPGKVGGSQPKNQRGQLTEYQKGRKEVFQKIKNYIKDRQNKKKKDIISFREKIEKDFQKKYKKDTQKETPEETKKETQKQDYSKVWQKDFDLSSSANKKLFKEFLKNEDENTIGETLNDNDELYDYAVDHNLISKELLDKIINGDYANSSCKNSTIGSKIDEFFKKRNKKRNG